MPRLILLAVLAFATFAPSPASAQMEAQEILWNCMEPLEGADYKQIMLYFTCLGYIQGAHDMMGYLFTYGGKKNEVYCIPEKGISVDQLRRVVIKWIKKNPEMMNATARQAIQWAMIDAFPCRKKREPPPG